MSLDLLSRRSLNIPSTDRRCDRGRSRPTIGAEAEERTGAGAERKLPGSEAEIEAETKLGTGNRSWRKK